MRRCLSVAELIRQDVLDLDPEQPRPACRIAPRLLILACSAAKAEGDRLAARDRHQGPLWQTLRAADPDGVRAFVCFLSARFGLGHARTVLPHRAAALRPDADRRGRHPGLLREHAGLRLTTVRLRGAGVGLDGYSG